MRKNRVFRNINLNSSRMVSDPAIIYTIKVESCLSNVDNISRTREYLNYYLLHPEIKWAFLASMVSRNAGWNMCDLKGPLYSRILDKSTCKRLYLTYERANWLIFHDAFPQLLLYHYSTIYNRPLFHLLKEFHVSQFMENEWQHFYHEKDCDRLMTALIINEQNIIQRPVIKHPVYKKRVFSSLMFKFQELFHLSCVLLPMLNGELYGASVKKFRELSKRIQLGKQLASILFYEHYFPHFLEFALATEHTGSRYDYEQYFEGGKGDYSPMLRDVYPTVDHHIHQYEDWSNMSAFKREWFSKPEIKKPVPLTEWFLSKNNQLKKMVELKEHLL